MTSAQPNRTGSTSSRSSSKIFGRLSNSILESAYDRYVLHTDPDSSQQQIAKIVLGLKGQPILDVGAAYGFLGRLIADRHLEIDAIEPYAPYAETSRRFYRHIYQTAVEEAPLPSETYKIIVLGDVLEHTVNPVAVLQSLRRAATPDATFVISLPNISHLSARLLILLGKFPQMDRGIFDRTHLHFYTRVTAAQMVESSGLMVLWQSVTPVPLPVILNADGGSILMRAAMLLQKILIGISPTLFGYQLLMTAKAAALVSANETLTSDLSVEDKNASQINATQAEVLSQPAPAASFNQLAPQLPITTDPKPLTITENATRTKKLAVQPKRKIVPLLFFALLLAVIVPLYPVWNQILNYSRITTIPTQKLGDLRVSGPNVRSLSGTMGITSVSNGSIYVADTNPQRLVKFTPNGSDYKIVASAGSTPGLVLPYAVASDQSGNVYVLDITSGDVFIFGANDSLIKKVPLTVSGSRAMTIDKSGNIYISYGGSGVRKFTSDLQPDGAWGGNTPVSGTILIAEVLGLATIGNDLFVSSANKFIRVDGAGKIVAEKKLIGSGGSMTSTPSGHLLTTDLPTNRIWIFDRDGNTMGRLVGKNFEEPIFFQPRGIALSQDGSKLYVANENLIGMYEFKEDAR